MSIGDDVVADDEDSTDEGDGRDVWGNPRTSEDELPPCP